MKTLAVFVAVAFGWTALGAEPAGTTLRGYSTESSLRERIVESQFLDIPSAQRALDAAAVIGARPHYAGTPGDYALAVYMRDAMKGAGLAAELESLAARVDTPRELVLELIRPGDRRRAPAPVAFDLNEPAEPSDPPTADRRIGLPFNAGSGDGDVRAPLVYVDRGLDADYATLAQANVDVRDAIVLVRYGAQFRGLLAERAQSRGAAGVIFYSDPIDDGAARGTVYPNGPWRALTSVERGSVGANVHIPTLPVSAANARLLLETLPGNDGPPGWRGALPVTYPLARGRVTVHLIVKLNRKTTTLWNVVGVIAGTGGEQSVLLGAHRDAWVYGVGDNGAGITTMLEVARGLGFLLKGGWRPQRSIVIAGWDGEEIGLAGSRAYERRHELELGRGCVAYLNADQNITGDAFSVDAVTALGPVITDVTRRVLDPAQPAATIFDRWVAQAPRSLPRVDAPGGGSDHEPFLYDAGLPIAELGFSGPFGAYHSSADTLRYAMLMSDPHFSLHRAAAQLYGLLALRLADADNVPYAFNGYIGVLRAGVTSSEARASRDGVDADFSDLARAIDRLAVAAARFDPFVARATRNVSNRELRAARLLDVLTYGKSGYTSVILPAIDAALDAHDRSAVRAAIGKTAEKVDQANGALTRD